MAKKILPSIGLMALGNSRPASSNNPDGPSVLPDDSINGEYYPKGKFDFAGLVAKGESPAHPDVNTVTANGVSKSRGQGRNAQFNWGDGTDGEWNKNEPWTGGNMTGQ